MTCYDFNGENKTMLIKAATITASNQWTATITAKGYNKIDVSIRGVTGSTVTLQRKRDGEDDSEYRDVKTWTADAEEIVEQATDWVYRLGVKSGEHGGGDTIEAEMGLS